MTNRTVIIAESQKIVKAFLYVKDISSGPKRFLTWVSWNEVWHCQNANKMVLNQIFRYFAAFVNQNHVNPSPKPHTYTSPISSMVLSFI